ncbi:hypothetical protein OAH12_03200 [Cyclobacteriaceae bacterium]|nr:hypothetical protein [Cyclobacteriaceae bacterium]
MESPLKYIYTGSAPQKEENKGLMILLHGYGSNEMDLHSFADQLPSQYFVVSVQAPIALPWGGFAWFDIDFAGADKKYDFDQALHSRERIVDFINYMIVNYDIDAENIALLGFSQGAMLSQAVALTEPRLIDKVVALSGFVFEDVIKPIQASTADIKTVDFFIGHGSVDDVVPVEYDRKSRLYLENLGVNLQYKEYPVAHGITPEELEDVVSFLK